jgi:hypothetical protein
MSCEEIRPIKFPIYGFIDELITRLALGERLKEIVEMRIWFNKDMAAWLKKFVHFR